MKAGRTNGKWFFVSGILILCLVCPEVNPAAAIPFEYNVKDFGAKGDGMSKDTEAIQQAIDACVKKGGGTVYIPSGVFLTGSIHLKSNLSLYLDHGAVLMASPDNEDFDPYEELGFKNDSDRETSYFHYAHLWGEDVERVAITGTGIIDGNRTKRGGPKTIALKKCKEIIIRDITIRNAPNYCISMLGTDHVNIDGVRIINGYCDGIDPDCCWYVRIANCQIDSRDDAIVPKASYTLGYRRSTEYLTVTNCILSTNANGFKLGTESRGDFKFITLSNCVIYREGKPGTSGVSLESVDGAHIDGVTVSNISIQNMSSPIFIRLGNRGRDQEVPAAGSIRNILMCNIVATDADIPCIVAGIPDHPVEHVTLDNIRISFKGGGQAEQTSTMVPEKIQDYPDADMFETLPSYGLFSRHVLDLRLSNVQFGLLGPEERHACFFEDVKELGIHSLSTDEPVVSVSQMRLVNVSDALISGCMPKAGTALFMDIGGEDNRSILLDGNDFSRVGKIYRLAKSIKKDPVRVVSPK